MKQSLKNLNAVSLVIKDIDGGKRMFCKNCGKKIDDKAVICPKCGVSIKQITSTPKNRQTAILLAIFFSYWTWLYTYKTDSGAFWTALIMSFFLWWTLIVPLAFWVVAIVYACKRDQEWYENY